MYVYTFAGDTIFLHLIAQGAKNGRVAKAKCVCGSWKRRKNITVKWKKKTKYMDTRDHVLILIINFSRALRGPC